MAGGRGLVDFDTQTRRSRRQPASRFGLQGVADHFLAPRNVGQHVFLDDEVRCAERKMQGRGIGHRSQRIMWGDTDVIRFRHGRNLLRLP